LTCTLLLQNGLLTFSCNLLADAALFADLDALQSSETQMQHQSTITRRQKKVQEGGLVLSTLFFHFYIVKGWFQHTATMHERDREGRRRNEIESLEINKGCKNPISFSLQFDSKV